MRSAKVVMCAFVVALLCTPNVLAGVHRASDKTVTYHDAVKDTIAADISSITVSHSGSEMTFRIGIANLGPGLVEGDFLAVLIDTDRNSSTGCSGAEVTLAVLGGTAPTPDIAKRGHCASGTWKFGPVSYSYVPGSGLDGPGSITLRAPTADIGTTNFNFAVATIYEGKSGNVYDTAGPYAFADSSTATVPLTIARHVDVHAEATGPTGARVGYAPAKVTGAKSVTYSKPSGSIFPLGRTVVTVTARNGTRTAKSTFAVYVADTTAPVIPSLAGFSTTATDPSGATVSYGPVTATDRVDGNLAVSCSPASGSVLPPGAATVTCTTHDRAGNVTTSLNRIVVPLFTDPIAVQTTTTMQYDSSLNLSGATTTITVAGVADPLAYTWTATSGTIAGNGAGATWTRAIDAGQPAPGTVTVTVTHTAGGSNTYVLAFA